MKDLAIALLALSLLPASAPSQEMPNAPSSAPDPAWSSLQSLADGRPVVVTTVDNRSVHCLFAGATDLYLLCNPAGNPPGVGYRFDRAEVASVDLDWPGQGTVQGNRPESDYHPRWIASMIAGGVIVGLCATRTNGAGTSAKAGLIGAGVIGLIGAPFAFLPHPPASFPPPVYPQNAIGLGIRFKALQHIRRIPILRILR